MLMRHSSGFLVAALIAAPTLVAAQGIDSATIAGMRWRSVGPAVFEGRVADITGMIAVDFMKPAKLAVPDTMTNLKRWYEDVSARPSAKA